MTGGMERKTPASRRPNVLRLSALSKRARPRVGDFAPAILGPLAIVYAYLARGPGGAPLFEKFVYEIIALVLTSATLLLFARTARLTRDPLQQFLTGFALVVLIREIHFYGSHRGTYFALAALAIWAWSWRDSLVASLELGRTKRWLYSGLLTYFLSVLMSRRALRILPDEQLIHVVAEEMIENVAHLLLLLTAVFSGRALAREPNGKSLSRGPG